MFHTISSRDLQRTPKKILDQAKKLNEPLIIIAENKPAGAIISLDLLKELKYISTLKALELEAINDYESGNTELIDTPEKLIGHFEEMDDMIYVQDKNRSNSKIQKRIKKISKK